MQSKPRIPQIFGISGFIVLVAILGLLPGAAGYAQSPAATPAATAASTTPAAALSGEVTLTLAGFSVPREAYADLLPVFQAEWLQTTGQKVTFNESYQGSGTQSRAIVGGFEADIAALSLEKDVSRIADAKLITHDWQNNPYKGIVATSVVVLIVRSGNPKHIQDWGDLAQPNLEIITPDPTTSGGAQWNILAAFGAAKRGKVAGYEGEDGAYKLMAGMFKNFTVLDKDARESFLNFERGVGDVAITYENEAYAGLAAGDKIEIIYPASSILIENPAAVIDVFVDKHGTRPAAEAFLNFLWTPQAQQIWANHGFRPVDPTVAKQDDNVKRFPALKDQFTIQEFGGWNQVGKDLFGDNGKISKLLIDVKGK